MSVVRRTVDGNTRAHQASGEMRGVQMADDRDGAREEAVIAVLKAVKNHADAAGKATTVAGVNAQAAAAKDFAEAYAWLISPAQPH